MAIGSDNEFPKIILVEQGSTPATPAAGTQKLFIDSADGKLKRVDESDTVTAIETDAGAGYDEGTSFPVSPSSGDKFYRTDRNLLYYYDGTRWLTTTLYVATPTLADAGTPPYSASPGTHGYLAVDPTYDMYLVALEGTTGIFGTNDASNYWTIGLDRRNAGNTNNNITSCNTSGDTASNWTTHSQAIDAVLTAGSKILIFTHAKTNGPANLYVTSRLTYRLIG